MLYKQPSSELKIASNYLSLHDMQFINYTTDDSMHTSIMRKKNSIAKKVKILRNKTRKQSLIENTIFYFQPFYSS